jgi:2-keto-3-deoxy-L-rhamnonate aldolase RhmA
VPVLNPLRQRLDNGEVAFGLGLRLARTMETVALAAGTGYHWLFIDLEHSALTTDTAGDLCMAALGAGIAPLVRISASDYTTAARLLDSGAWGILLPHIEGPEQAAEAVRELKFPPEGHRSVSYGLAQLGFTPMPRADAARHFNEQMVLLAMIESPRAVTQAEAIAAVPGIDGLFVGTNDLSMDLGVADDLGAAGIRDAYAQVVAACRAHGKWPAVGGVYTEELVQRAIDQGMRLILAGTDMALLLDGLRQRSAMLQRCLTAAKPAD